MSPLRAAFLSAILAISLTGCLGWANKDDTSSDSSASTMGSFDEPVFVAWRFVAEQETGGIPRTHAYLEITGPEQATVDLGLFDGRGIDTRTLSAERDVGDNVLGAIFWQENSSTEIALERVDGALHVKERTSTVAGPTDWTIKHVIPLPGQAALTVEAYTDPYQ